MKYKYPFTKQEGLKNCACACIQMIVKYYKGYISMSELENLLSTNKDGTSAYKIVEGLRKLGFESQGIKTTLNEISPQNLILPCIAFVTIDKKYNHYVVIYKINFNKKKILIADPASYLKYLSFDEFEEIWNNVLITMYPVKNITRNKEINFKDFISENKILFSDNFLSFLIISLCIVILTLISSLGIKYFYECINKDKNVLFLVFSFFLIIELFKIISEFLRNKLLIFVNKKLDISMNMEVYKKVINLPYQYYRNRTTGEIISKISELGKVRTFVNNIVVIIFLDVPIALVAGIILYFIEEKLFFLSCVIFVNYVLIFLLSKHYFEKVITNYYNKKAELISFMHESINGFETVKGLNIEKNIIKRYEHKYIDYLRKIVKIDNFINTQRLFKDLNENIGQLIILFIGIILISDGKILISDYLAFNSISMFFFSPIRNILSLDLSYEEAKKAYKNAYEIICDDKKQISNKKTNGNIKVNSLTYYFNDKKKVLDNINLEIKEGEKILITGKSGSGKSTLMKIIKKYYEVEYGKVKIGNIDVNDTCKTDNLILYVSQNEVLFTDTLYNNLSLYNVDIDRIAKVLEECYIDEFIDKNLGCNMLIEENGFNISGGQKQRIILARALLQEFNILIVDEGTSQIDVNLERKILKNIFKNYKSKTMIFISHRLENMDLYDRIIELKEGRVIKDIKKCKT